MSNILKLDRKLYDSLAAIFQSGVAIDTKHSMNGAKFVTTHTTMYTLTQEDTDVLYKFIIDKEPELINKYNEKEIKGFIESEMRYQFTRASRTRFFLKKWFSYSTIALLILILIFINFGILRNVDVSSFAIAFINIAIVVTYILYGVNRSSYPVVSDDLTNGITNTECDRVYNSISMRYVIHVVINALIIVILVAAFLIPVINIVYANNIEKKEYTQKYNELNEKVLTNISKIDAAVNDSNYYDALEYVSLDDLDTIKSYEKELALDPKTSSSYMQSIISIYKNYIKGEWVGDSNNSDYPYTLYYFDSSEEFYITYISTGIDNEEELKNVANENESYRVDINNIVTNIHSQVISIDSRSENGSIDLDCSHINDSILIIEGVEFKKVQ